MVTINAKASPQQYAVGATGTTDCTLLETVQHVTHSFRAAEILRSKVATGRLVYDQSTLNTSRTQVVWLSPNHWFDGFRYGTVALSFDWKMLVANRKAYWIEVAEYSPHACRILLTDRPHPNLQTYEPQKRNGPIESAFALANGTLT